MSESRSFHYLNEVALAYDDEVGCDWWIDRADYYNSDKDTDMKYITVAW
jgi:hypothetical protein